MTSDCIYISGIRAYGYTGVLPAEQELGQWFEVDFWVWLDLSKAGQTDNLDHTYDYRLGIKSVRELIRTSNFSLIEKLADAIAETILTAAQVEQVHVRLTKVSPPIPDFSGKVAIEITRSKSSKA